VSEYRLRLYEWAQKASDEAVAHARVMMPLIGLEGVVLMLQEQGEDI
jgi:hypothetical protein